MSEHTSYMTAEEVQAESKRGPDGRYAETGGAAVSAIEATSAGFKDMADGTVRFFFDVEPRHAQDALTLFRVRGTAAALAALKPAHLQEPEPTKPKPSRMRPLCEWAVYRCQEQQFQQWVAMTYDRVMGGDGSGWGDVTPQLDFGGDMEKYAAHAVKVICNVGSRSELDDEPAKTVFKNDVMAPYAEWLKARETETA